MAQGDTIGLRPGGINRSRWMYIQSQLSMVKRVTTDAIAEVSGGGSMVKLIELAQLNVDLTNYRIGEFDTQREAIKALLAHQGKKIVNLARDILELGTLNPSEHLIVIHDPEEEGQYLVLEGNRRVAALKTMATPELADGLPIAKDFAKLAAQFAENPIRTVSCLVMKSKDDALPWIERKHSTKLEGRGLEQWDALAHARAEADKGKVRPSKASLDYLRARGVLPHTVEVALNKKTTTVDRVLNMPYFTQVLGVAFDTKTGAITFENGDEAAGADLLLRILRKMSEKAFTVNDVRTKDQRTAFIDGYAAFSVKKRPNGSAGGTSGDSSAGNGGGKEASGSAFGGSDNSSGGTASGSGGSAAGAGPGSTSAAAAGATKGQKKSASNSLKRKMLIPSGGEWILKINNVARLNRIYLEGRKLDVEEYTNAAAVLLRVFIELSSEAFLKALKVPVPKGLSSWSDRGISLDKKIDSVLAELDPSSKDKELDWARKRGDKVAIHSIDTLHGYMHNIAGDPDPTEVKRTYERWHPYLRKMFEKMETAQTI